MELLLPLGIVVLLIWLVVKSRRKTQKAPPPVLKSVPPAQRSPTSVRGAIVPRPTVTGSECWVSPGQATSVCGYVIRGGMIYVGEGLASVSGSTLEHALINPGLPVNRSRPDRSGAGMGYWPSYALIPPECRAAYLEWLAGGRRDPTANVGYVFLFFYGLERRALAEARHSEEARAELPAIVDEVEQLLRIYNDNRSFRGYARQFLDVVGLVAAGGGGEITPPMERTGYELPLALRVGMAVSLADERAVDQLTRQLNGDAANSGRAGAFMLDRRELRVEVGNIDDLMLGAPETLSIVAAKLTTAADDDAQRALQILYRLMSEARS